MPREREEDKGQTPAVVIISRESVKLQLQKRSLAFIGLGSRACLGIRQIEIEVASEKFELHVSA